MVTLVRIQDLKPGTKTFELKDNYTFFDPKLLRTVKEFGNLTKQQKRCYQRLRSGIDSALDRGKWLRFMTLTTGPKVTKHLNNSFKAFKMRVERAKIGKDGFKGFKFNKYMKIETTEGNGVLHIVYWGTKKHYLPQKWISKTWKNLHNSPIADIRLIKEKGRLVNYLVGSYLTDQPIKRISCGWKWLWLGFVKSWEKMKDVYAFGLGRVGIGKFKNVMACLRHRLKDPPSVSRQKKLILFI